MSRAIPDDRLYTRDHEWVKIDANTAYIGISDHAQCALGDVVYVELPEPARRLQRGAAIGVVESVKAVSDIYAPLSGVVKAVNKQVIDNPELINQDPYGEGWLIECDLSDLAECTSLLDKDAYHELLACEAK